MVQNMSSQKVTVTIPYELKEKLNNLKDELHTSVSAIYKEALENYLEKKELEKWQDGANLASKDKNYLEFVNELNSDLGDDIYEY